MKIVNSDVKPASLQRLTTSFEIYIFLNFTNYASNKY